MIGMTINGILNNNRLMYKIYISGNGFEITQGALPMETIEQIYSEIENELALAEYLIDAVQSDDKLNWFEVDDNFHELGADMNDSILYVEDSQGIVVFKKPCDEIKNHITITTELYPEDFELELIGVLTCIEKIKGTFFTGYIDTKDFNPNNIQIDVKSLGDTEVVYSIGYEGKELSNIESSEYSSIDFNVYLDK